MARRVVSAAAGLTVAAVTVIGAVHLGARPTGWLLLPAIAVAVLIAAFVSKCWRELAAAGRRIDEANAMVAENRAIYRARDVLTVDAATRWRAEL
ncbi:hypothetical protein ACFFX1_54650 [Dactylosporangium sucinum]|uniref:Uncharacterized protein n=1 Tax=Dactylosporangium sucinum TaxID=1424081 RepID=A0A917X0E3_9ACTN|nr:hypothetical protein [Dactylosporangium sucinum]GGM53843.1 hypothetical protein GCM10007977_064280 [Dactylosporangium sucinum]